MRVLQNLNRSQDEIARSASIHDTALPENLSRPVELLDGYLQVPSDSKLTTTEPAIEQSAYTSSPSVKAELPPKKAKRTSRNQSKRKKPWNAKKAPIAWKYLAQQPAWALLSEDERMQLILGWPNRHFCYSYQEIADALGCSIQAAKRRIKKWEDKKQIKKKKNFLKRRGKVLGIHKRNYYVFTKQRKKEITALVRSLFLVSPEVAKSEPLKDSNKLEDFCQDRFATSNDEKIFENKGNKENNLEFEKSEEYHDFLEKKYEELLAQEEQLKPEMATIIGMHGFEKEIPSLAKWLRLKINETSPRKIVKILKWLEGKKKKRFRIKDFWAIFVWCMKNGIPISWMTKMANDYMAAIEGKATMQGIDSAGVVAAIIKLQEKTGRKVTKREMIGLLHYGTSHLKAYVDFTLFKSNRIELRDWVAFVHAMAKKSITEISNMYKSEEKLRADREAEDALLQGARNQRDVTDWDRLIKDLEECDQVFAATGTSGEIWD